MTYGVIYKITNIVNNKIYIGQTTKSIRRRWSQHKNCSKKLVSPLYRAMTKYGFESFIIEQVDTAETRKTLNEKEEYYINIFNSRCPNGYNIACPLNQKNVYEDTRTKEKLSKIMSEKAKKRWKTMPEEERLKYVKRRLGKHLSDEVKKRISEANKGRKLTKEQKKNISEGHKNLKTGFLCWYKDGKIIRRKECPGEGWIRGTPNGNDKVYYKQRRVRCIESNLIYSCLSEVERKLGFDRSYVGKSCKTGKACYGYHFEFIDGEPL